MTLTLNAYVIYVSTEIIRQSFGKNGSGIQYFGAYSFIHENISYWK